MSETTGPTATCNSCGAPDGGELVTCRFCQHAVSAEALAKAVPCPDPACRRANRWGKQKCAACQAWIVVACVFCGAISPHNISNCLKCNEAFAGAQQRKAGAQQHQQHQQNMQAVGTWGNVAAVFAGAALGASVGGSYSSSSDDYASSSDDSPRSSSTFDVSNVIDDISDSFSDD